jgi:ABC-type spermidine/putrescine transport system permease subunit I
VLLQRHGVVNSLLMGWEVIDAPLPLVYNFTGTVIGMAVLWAVSRLTSLRRLTEVGGS